MAPPPVPVTAAPVQKKTVPVVLRTIGNVEAYATVSVKALVGGELLKVHFREGQEVKAGDLLFTIDPRPHQAALREAQARLARDLALLKKAQDDARRYARLIQDDLISREQFDQITATAQALEATVRADEAAVDSARLKLEYCTIRAPIAGRTGSLLVHQGNIVKAEDEKHVLVVIHQIQPIYASFTVPEQHTGAIKTALAAGSVAVTAVIPGEEARPVHGRLTFVDHAVDQATGTLRLKATFPNEDKRLWPGQFVEVTLKLADEPDALVLPARAVQTGQGEQYVFVIRADQTVEYRAVTVKRHLEGETVLAGGVTPGETVVTDGHLRLTPGARVAVKDSGDGG
ncbi:MAG: efflux RND transporter periplasmic adaptor subunit [Syntrophobacterales bacterium]|nr:efflux RND transporter periplasmic adaptor subunit [Syntrophobacterales bacterium]